MTAQREDDLGELKAWLVRLQEHVKADRKLQHQNSFIELENVFRDLLNLVFGWNLQNANLHLSGNQDSFDLFDKSESLAVQVTVTTGAKKIRKTLNSFIGTHDHEFQRLCFIYPQIDTPKVSADFTAQLNGYPFDPAKDCLSFDTILNWVRDKSVLEIQQVLQLIRRELKPLGEALQLGTDATLETLISTIQFMSDNAPLGQIPIDESKPDIELKLRRLQEHARYLLSQYRSNASFHATIDQARAAIGYDHVRAAKIQAWLQSNSIDMLATHSNNATSAFQSLVALLLGAAHKSGRDAEETAVRFLLADEFVRCNLFPNPIA